MDLSALIGDIADVPAEGGEEGEASETSVEETSETPETEGESSEEEDSESEDDSEESGDGEEWTPERIAKERAALKEERAKLQKFHSVEKKKRQTFNRQRETFLTEKKTFESTREQVLSDVKTMRVGEPMAVIEALGRLTGKDPHDVYKEMSLALVGKPVETEKDSKHAQELAELKAWKEQQEALREQEAHQRHITEGKKHLEKVISEGTDWPFISAVFRDDPQGAVNDIANKLGEHYTATGEAIDFATFLRQLEPQVKAHLLRVQGLSPDKGPAGPDTGAQGAKPGGRESPTKPGTTVSASLASQSAGKRPRTEDEQLAYAAELLPDNLFR